MKLLKDYIEKLDSFYYFFIWGFYFSASYLVDKNIYDFNKWVIPYIFL